MRAAIIGLGVIGNVHAKLLALQGEEIVALCDVDTAAAEAVRAAALPHSSLLSFSLSIFVSSSGVLFL